MALMQLLGKMYRKGLVPGRRLLDIACGRPHRDGGGAWIAISTWGIGGEIYATDTGVGDVGVRYC